VDLADRVGAALGRPVRFVEVSREEAVEVLTPAMGENAAWYVDSVLAGSATQPTSGTPVVEELTGRPATTFAEWAVRHADDFR
jgi:hypothetical protein